jgi:hypothetical protein
MAAHLWYDNSSERLTSNLLLSRDRSSLAEVVMDRAFWGGGRQANWIMASASAAVSFDFIG